MHLNASLPLKCNSEESAHLDHDLLNSDTNSLRHNYDQVNINLYCKPTNSVQLEDTLKNQISTLNGKFVGASLSSETQKQTSLDTSSSKSSAEIEIPNNKTVPNSTQGLSHKASIDSLYSLDSHRPIQKPSDTLILYDFPTAVLYKYPLHASLVPKDYDQCPRVSDLLIQQSSMFVVARGRFQIYKIRGLDSDNETSLVTSVTSTPASANTQTTNNTVSKDSEGKSSTDYSKTLSYLRCGHMVHPILPKMRIWKISKNMYILPQPSPKNFWRLEIEFQNDDKADIAFSEYLDELDNILKETCYYQSIYVPLPIDLGSSLSESAETNNPKYQSTQTTQSQSTTTPLPQKNLRIERLTKHFENEREKNEPKGPMFRKRASVEFKNVVAQSSPLKPAAQQNKNNFVSGRSLDILSNNSDRHIIEGNSSSLENNTDTNIKGFEANDDQAEPCPKKNDELRSISFEKTDINDVNEKATKQHYGNEVSKQDLNTKNKDKNIASFENTNHQSPVSCVEKIGLSNTEAVLGFSAENVHDLELSVDDPFGFPLSQSGNSTKSLPTSINNNQLISPTLFSETSVSQSPRDSNFYLQQEYPSPTVSELFGEMSSNNQHEHTNPQDIDCQRSFSGSQCWSGYSSPVSKNSAISSSSTLDHILDAFENTETRFGSHFQTTQSHNINSNTNHVRNSPSYDVLESEENADANNTPGSTVLGKLGQLRSLGFSGFTSLSNIGSLNLGSIGSSFRGFGNIGASSSTSHLSSGVFGEESITVFNESAASFDGQLTENGKGKGLIRHNTMDTGDYGESVSSTETLTFEPFGKANADQQIQQDRQSLCSESSFDLGSRIPGLFNSKTHDNMLKHKLSLVSLSTTGLISNSSFVHSGWALPTNEAGFTENSNNYEVSSRLKHSQSHSFLNQRTSANQNPFSNRIGFIGPITKTSSRKILPLPVSAYQTSFPNSLDSHLAIATRPRRNSVGATESTCFNSSKTVRRSSSQASLSRSFFTSNLNDHFLNTQNPRSDSGGIDALPNSKQHTMHNKEKYSQVDFLDPHSLSSALPKPAASVTSGLSSAEKHAQLFDYTKMDIKDVQRKGAGISKIYKK